MKNLSYSIKISAFLNTFYKDLQNLNESLTSDLYESNTLIQRIIIDDFWEGTNFKRIFENEIYLLRNNLDELKNVYPVLPELKSDFSNILEKILTVSINYIETYESDIALNLKNLIVDEKKSHSVIINDIPDFLENNQFKRFYEICITIKSLLSEENKSKKQKAKNQKNNPDEFEIKINKALDRLKLFKEKDEKTKKPYLNDSDYELLTSQLKKFIMEAEYEKPTKKIDHGLPYKVIKYLFIRINSDLYMKSENRIDRKTRDFIQFMIDFFKFPSTWNKDYISKHYKDRIDIKLHQKYKKYLQN